MERHRPGKMGGGRMSKVKNRPQAADEAHLTTLALK